MKSVSRDFFSDRLAAIESHCTKLRAEGKYGKEEGPFSLRQLYRLWHSKEFHFSMCAVEKESLSSNA